jgi:DNA-binding NtrC family response regulator
VLERGFEIGVRSLMLDWSPESEAARGGAPADAILLSGIAPLEMVERELISRAMRATGENTTRAAELLGISRDQLRYRLKKFGRKGSEGAD